MKHTHTDTSTCEYINEHTNWSLLFGSEQDTGGLLTPGRE